MEGKVKHIKKEDLKNPSSEVEARATAVPGDGSTVVKSWIKEFQAERREETTGTFDSLFTDSNA
jgi:hypothetical protein